MAIRDHDGNIESGRSKDSWSPIGIVAAVFIAGLLMLFIMVRADAPISSTTNTTKAPVTTSTPSTPSTPK